MIEVIKVVASVVLFFGGAVLVSYGLFSLMSSRRHRLELLEGSSVRLVGPGGAYRCHFIGYQGEHLAFTSPIQADRYVPIRVGERLYVQAPGRDCMMGFRTEVVSRDSEEHVLLTTVPEVVKKIERRSESRANYMAGEIALIDGEPATIEDLSAGGACLLSRRRPDPGQRLRVVLPECERDADGWAIESTPAAMGTAQGYRVRVQFTEPLAGLTRRAR